MHGLLRAATRLNRPNPAIVSQRAVQRLPRLALLLFCTAYVVPGVFGRDPWKNADMAAFGTMANIAEGRTPWWAPTVGGLVGDIAPLPYALGAVFIRALAPFVDAPLAARLPFALLLLAVLMLVWYATYHLARTDAAQPLPFAFGGEANHVDYARAIADGAVLAVIATLGLLQLGHETTPELAQLTGAALYVYGLSAAPFRAWRSRLAALFALPVLAASGAPTIALALGVAGLVVCARSSTMAGRRFAGWVVAGMLAAATIATVSSAWEWRIGGYRSGGDFTSLLRLLLWFMWPAWALACWTLWRWRSRWLHRHIAVPLTTGAVCIGASIAMGGSDRALMLALPSVAVLAAFALPTFRRSLSAAIDWFSVCFFTSGAIAIWVIYLSLQTGVPAKPAANIARLAPGYASSFSLVALVAAMLGTLAWIWLVKWRTGRHRHALWKSLVLPASGVALCWLLVMTLLLPVLDYALSFRAQVERIAERLPPGSCLLTTNLTRAQVAALQYHGRYGVDAVTPPSASSCAQLARVEAARRSVMAPEGWQLVTRAQRPAERDEAIAIYRRNAAPN